MAKLIETEYVKRAYGMDGVNAIVDHPKHGRLLLMDGFGSSNSIEGECVRWKHGAVWSIKADDTIASLKAAIAADKGNYNHPELIDEDNLNTLFDITLPGRTQLNWDGVAIDKVATSVGL